MCRPAPCLSVWLETHCCLWLLTPVCLPARLPTRLCVQQGIGKTHVMVCPKGIVGRIIGRQGDTIKQLQRVTGALNSRAAHLAAVQHAWCTASTGIIQPATCQHCAVLRPSAGADLWAVHGL